jgi:hypothetical protein
LLHFNIIPFFILMMLHTWSNAKFSSKLLFGLNKIGASIGRSARECGIGVGTVVLYTQRVVMALLSLERQYVSWPYAEERSVIAVQMAVYRVRGCLGYVDGTYVVLRYCPMIDGEQFFHQKS